MSAPVIASVASREQIEAVAALAREIWTEYYVPIIGRPQVDFMLERFQSARAIEDQIASGMEYFLIHAAGEPRGYFAVRAEPPERRMFLSKLYVHENARGQRLGRLALGHIEALCGERGLQKIWLTVNKGNPSIALYERMGFRKVEAIVMDIGGGYVMDDFRMEKAVPP